MRPRVKGTAKGVLKENYFFFKERKVVYMENMCSVSISQGIIMYVFVHSIIYFEAKFTHNGWPTNGKKRVAKVGHTSKTH